MNILPQLLSDYEMPPELNQ